jgi:hypothetical protein
MHGKRQHNSGPTPGNRRTEPKLWTGLLADCRAAPAAGDTQAQAQTYPGLKNAVCVQVGTVHG